MLLFTGVQRAFHLLHATCQEALCPRGNPRGVVSLAGVLASAFIATNLDATVALGILFSIDRPRYRRYAIATACAGFAVVLAVAVAAALVVHRLPQAWIRFSGLLPIGVAIARLIAWIRSPGELTPRDVVKYTSIFSAVLATGVDNAVVYAAIFATLPVASIATTCGIYLVAFGIFCFLLLQLVRHGVRVRFPRAVVELGTAATLVAVGVALMRLILRS